MNAILSKLPYPYGKSSAEAARAKPDNATHITVLDDLAKANLGLGDLVRVIIVLERKDNVLWLPPQAIRKFEGRQYVLVQDDSGQHRVDVQIGIVSNDRVEISDGLSEGQEIVSP